MHKKSKNELTNELIKENKMGFKRVETGIYSYYKDSDPKKKHIAYYVSVTGEDGNTKKVRSRHTDIRNVRSERRAYSHSIKPLAETFVYILECDGFYKIGMSKDVQSRINDMQIGNPHKINLVYKFSFKDPTIAFEIEKMLHKDHKEHNIGGEWFSQLNEDVIKALKDGSYGI